MTGTHPDGMDVRKHVAVMMVPDREEPQLIQSTVTGPDAGGGFDVVLSGTVEADVHVDASGEVTDTGDDPSAEAPWWLVEYAREVGREP